MVDTVTRRRLIRWSLCVVATLTVLSGALHGLIAPPTGLVRTVYAPSGFSGAPLSQDRTTEVSLAFLHEDPTLPRRFFSVEWEGFWFLPRTTTVELYAGGDDRVDVLVDGERVLQRNIALGMHTIGETLTLSAGPHAFTVRYEQDGGGMHLNVQRAFEGTRPAPFASTRLFPKVPDIQDVWLATGTYWLLRVVALLWLVLLVGLLIMVVPRTAGLWRRAAARVPGRAMRRGGLAAAGLGVGLSAVRARLPGWDPESLWSDDLVWGAIIRAQDFWSMLTVPIPAPPGLFALLRGSYALFGDPEWSLQLLPFVCGIAAIPAMALVAWHLTGSSGLALLAAALTALNSLLAHYSVFVHHYTFEFLVTSLILLAATWLLMDTRAERPTLRRVGWVSTLAGLGMFFSITSVLVSFPVVNLTALAALRRWSRDRRHVLAVLGWASVYNVLVLAGYVLLRDRSNEAARIDFRAGFFDPSSLDSTWRFLSENGRRLIEASLPSWVAVEPWNPVPMSWVTPFVFLGLVWLLARRPTRLFGLAVVGFYAAFLLASAMGIYPLGMGGARGRTDIFAFPVGICLFVSGIHLVTESLPRAALARAAIGLTAAAIAMARPIPVQYWPVNDVHLVQHLSAAAGPSDGVILSPSGAALTAFYGSWPVTISVSDTAANATQVTIGRDRTVHLPRGGVSPGPYVAALIDDARPERVWYVAFRTGESTEVLRTLAAQDYATQEVLQTRMGNLYLAVRGASRRPEGD